MRAESSIEFKYNDRCLALPYLCPVFHRYQQSLAATYFWTNLTLILSLQKTNLQILRMEVFRQSNSIYRRYPGTGSRVPGTVISSGISFLQNLIFFHMFIYFMFTLSFFTTWYPPTTKSPTPTKTDTHHGFLVFHQLWLGDSVCHPHQKIVVPPLQVSHFQQPSS